METPDLLVMTALYLSTAFVLMVAGAVVISKKFPKLYDFMANVDKHLGLRLKPKNKE